VQYTLYVKIGPDWHPVAHFEATNCDEAFGKAISRLPPEHMDKPIALGPDGEHPAEAQ